MAQLHSAHQGRGQHNVWGGTEYLTEIALGRQVEVGTDVVVVGGGNTAIDAARTAKRMGANVTIMYRRTEAEMPANKLEIHAAKEEGVNLLFLAGPTQVIQDENNRVAEVEYITMELGEPDASGRRSPVPKEGSEARIKATTLIAAIGQYPNPCYVEHGGATCEMTRRKTLSVNPITMQTTVPDVFAAGDGVTGPSLVVTAIGGGRRAARGIHYYLMQGEIPVAAGHFARPHAGIAVHRTAWRGADSPCPPAGNLCGRTRLQFQGSGADHQRRGRETRGPDAACVAAPPATTSTRPRTPLQAWKRQMENIRQRNRFRRKKPQRPGQEKTA